MKRFILFAWDVYYPAGGCNDMIGQFDTADEAKECLVNRAKVYRTYDEAEILDIQTGERIEITPPRSPPSPGVS